MSQNQNPTSSVEILRFLSQIHRTQIDKRREYEWKTFFSTLGVYALSAVAKLAGDVTVPDDRLFDILVWGAFLSLAMISSAYLFHIHESHEADERFAVAAESALIKISGISELEQAQKAITQKQPKRNWSRIWQFVTILVFSLASSYLITM